LAPTRCWNKERDTGGGRREEGTETRKAKGGRLHGRHSGAVEAVEMARSGIAQRRTSQFPGNTTRLRRNLFPAPVSFPPKPKARAHHWLAECGFLSASFQIWEGRSRSAGIFGNRKQEAGSRDALPFLQFFGVLPVWTSAKSIREAHQPDKDAPPLFYFSCRIASVGTLFSPLLSC